MSQTWNVWARLTDPGFKPTAWHLHYANWSEEAAKKKCDKSNEMARHYGTNMSFVCLPDGKDPNTMRLEDLVH